MLLLRSLGLLSLAAFASAQMEGLPECAVCSRNPGELKRQQMTDSSAEPMLGRGDGQGGLVELRSQRLGLHLREGGAHDGSRQLRRPRL